MELHLAFGVYKGLKQIRFSTSNLPNRRDQQKFLDMPQTVYFKNT